jgi:solute:Na+ symporter, SSS family
MENPVSFGLVNYAVLFLYLAGMVYIGVRLAGKQKTTDDYFLAGRDMPWIVVGMSIFASITSAITYMGVPGLVYEENVSFYVGMLMMPVAAPFIIYLFLPFYRELEVTTSYEYVYKRFGQPARYTVSGLFLLTRLGWLGTVIYAPALALSVVTGMNIWITILLMGVLGTVYTVLGGLAAVIWTDVAQFIVLAGGAVWVAATLILGTPDGFSGIMKIAAETGHLNLHEWRPNLYEMTVSVVAISYFIQFMHDYGVDQVTVQRLLATRSFAAMARATCLNALFTVVIVGILAFIGLGLFAYNQANPGLLPETLERDKVFPYYIVHALPVGISGLVITGIFAAAMSSVDSGINSLSTVVVNDFVRPLRKAAASETHDVWLARVLTVVFGGFATGVAFFASSIGNIIKTSQGFIGLFSGPVLALFLLGILTRRGSFSGWVVGTAVALPATMWVQKATDVHFVYYFPMSFFISFLVGGAISFLIRGEEVEPRLTLWKK